MSLFGPLPIEPKELARQLVQRIRPPLTWQSSDADWTRDVIAVLRSLGKTQRHEVAPDPQADTPEFLFDVVWWKDSDSNDILVAAESEWVAENKVLEDFGKLLTVKAPLKVMIFSTKDQTQAEHLRREIEQKYLMKFTQHVEGECYLFIDFRVSERKAYAFRFSPCRNGAVDNVVFEELLAAPVELHSGQATSPAA